MEKSFGDMAQIIAQSKPLSGQRWILHASNIIGRDSTCDIVIPDRQVSRQHARLSITEEGVTLEDLSSKNGTTHNGSIITEPVHLVDGDEFGIAIAQTFIFISSDATLPLDERDEMLISSGEYEKFLIKSPSIHRLRLDKRSHRVWILKFNDNKSIEENEILPPLSVSQFRLLEKLYQNQGLIVSRPELVETVWGEKQVFNVSEQALDALIRRLRQRISTADPDYAYIITVRGHGLRLDNPILE